MTKELKHLLNKINKVTSCHRHGRPIPEKYLDELADAQIEYERAERQYNTWEDIHQNGP